MGGVFSRRTLLVRNLVEARPDFVRRKN